MKNNKKTNVKIKKRNKMVGLCSADYKQNDLSFDKNINTFINRSKVDKFSFNRFYNNEIENEYNTLKTFRDLERINHEFTNKQILESKKVEIEKLSKKLTDLNKKINREEAFLNSIKKISIIPFLPILAFIADFTVIFSRLETVLVQSSFLTSIISTMLCVVLDISPVGLKELIKNYKENKSKVFILSLAILITACFYLVICVSTMDSMYSDATLIATEKTSLSAPQISVGLLLFSLPLISTALILSLDSDCTLFEVIRSWYYHFILNFQNYKKNNLELEKMELEKDISYDYDDLDKKTYKLVCENDKTMEVSDIYNAKKLLAISLNDPIVVDMLMRYESNVINVKEENVNENHN